MTRVATTVAMALAVSWKPLMKSNSAARAMIVISKNNGLGILDHHRSQNVGHILAAVGRALKLLIDLLPADQIEELVAMCNQPADRRARDAVGLVLEPV